MGICGKKMGNAKSAPVAPPSEPVSHWAIKRSLSDEEAKQNKASLINLDLEEEDLEQHDFSSTSPPMTSPLNRPLAPLPRIPTRRAPLPLPDCHGLPLPDVKRAKAGKAGEPMKENQLNSVSRDLNQGWERVKQITLKSDI